jgi:hypothetical protein
MAKWVRFCISNRQEIPRSLPRWHDPDPLGNLSPATILKAPARTQKVERASLATLHSGRLKVETDSDPPAVLSTSMCRTTPVATGCHAAGCLARVLSATRGHLSESFSHNIYFCKTQKVFARKNIAYAPSTQAGSGTPQVG